MQRRINRLFFILLMSFAFVGELSADTLTPKSESVSEQPPTNSSLPNPDAAAKADRTEQRGLELIDQGEMAQGLDLLREALREDPQANRHLNLGSILFGNGVTLQKQGKSDEAEKIFAEAQAELLQAVQQFDPKEETTFISEGYNLLGELAVASNDKLGAKKYFEKSISFYENPAAKRGLAGL
jgi:tetratricopeptide (TPR) repeat protein